MKNLYLIILLSIFISGCATMPAGYIPKTNQTNKNIILDKADRKDITFSISFNSEVGNEESDKLYKMLMNTIKEKFTETKLFRRVHFVPFEQRGKYHYHFDMKLTGSLPNQQIAIGTLGGMTMLTIPVVMNFYVDTTMYLYINNKEVYSISSPELVRDIYWLPLIILTPFLNHHTVGASIINNNIEYFLENIIENKLY